MKYMTIILLIVLFQFRVLAQNYPNELKIVQKSYEKPLPDQSIANDKDKKSFQNWIKIILELAPTAIVSDSLEIVGNKLNTASPIQKITVKVTKNTTISYPEITFSQQDTMTAKKELLAFLNNMFGSEIVSGNIDNVFVKEVKRQTKKYGYSEDSKINDNPYLPLEIEPNKKDSSSNQSENGTSKGDGASTYDSKIQNILRINDPNFYKISLASSNAYNSNLYPTNNLSSQSIMMLRENNISLGQLPPNPPALSDRKVKIDFSFSRIVLGLSFLSESLMGGTKDKYTFIEVEANANEKLLNCMPLQNNSIHVGFRSLLPLSASGESGIDAKLYVKIKNKIFKDSKFINNNSTLGIFNRNYDLNAKLDFPNTTGFAIDLNYYEDPFYLNIWASFASPDAKSYKLEKDTEYLDKNERGEYVGYYNSKNLQVTHGFYWEFSNIHLFRLNVGIGTHDVSKVTYASIINIETIQTLEAGLRPVIDFQYNYILKRDKKDDYSLLGFSSKYYDNYIKGVVWINLFNDYVDSLEKVALTIRPEFYSLIKLSKKSNPWDEKGSFAAQLRLIVNF